MGKQAELSPIQNLHFAEKTNIWNWMKNIYHIYSGSNEVNKQKSLNSVEVKHTLPKKTLCTGLVRIESVKGGGRKWHYEASMWDGDDLK